MTSVSNVNDIETKKTYFEDGCKNKISFYAVFSVMEMDTHFFRNVILDHYRDTYLSKCKHCNAIVPLTSIVSISTQQYIYFSHNAYLLLLKKVR